jgi:hypothetical protein
LRSRGDGVQEPGFAQGAVGVDPGVADVDLFADQLGSGGSGGRENAGTVSVADREALPVPGLANIAQRRGGYMARFKFAPGRLASRAIRGGRPLQDRALEPKRQQPGMRRLARRP